MRSERALTEYLPAGRQGEEKAASRRPAVSERGEPTQRSSAECSGRILPGTPRKMLLLQHHVASHIVVDVAQLAEH